MIQTLRATYSGLPRTAWLLALANAVNRSGSMVLAFLALYLVEERGYLADEAGRLQSLYGVAAIGGSWLGGALSDRIGSKRVQVSSLLLGACCFLLLAVVRGTVGIAIGLVLLGVVSEALRPANLTAMSLIGDESLRPRVIALNRLAVNFGVTFGWLIGGWLASIGYVWIFVVDAATSIAAAVVVSRIDIPLVLRPPGLRPPLLPIKPLRDTKFAFGLLLFLVFATVLFQMESTFPIYMRNDYQLDKMQIATLFAVNTIMIVALEMMLVKKLERRSPLPLVSIGVLLLCLALGILPLGSSYGFAVGCIVILTFGEMLWSPFATTWVASRSSSSERGQYMGCFLLMFATAYAIAPATGTWLYQEYGHDTPWWCVLAIGPLLALGFIALHRSTKPRTV